METATPEISLVIDPVPRTFIHASYMFMKILELRKSKIFWWSSEKLLPYASMARMVDNRRKDFEIDNLIDFDMEEAEFYVCKAGSQERSKILLDSEME